ncbi:hypothetical protein V6N13_108546 [Hibiscus sabdariffa]|uniref:Reverse transcriptase zinc-binding domain-containing protein n=1 Tax=Hibiscus sabdariffa TaxID=183260 RepID=A0ABR2SSX3_9ROSI
MTTSGSWNSTLLFSLFHEQVARRIFSQRCPSSNDIIDFCRWRWNPQFSISEAYSKIMEEKWDPHSNDGHAIWSLPVSQRTRVFIWLALRQKLMSNMERHRRGLTENPSCIHCGLVESIDHILWGCPYARNVWFLIFGANQMTITFFTGDMKPWLLTNLRSNASPPYSTVPWSTLFASICWHIWKSQNENVSVGTCQTPASLIQHSLTWAKHFAKSVTPPTSHSQHASSVSTFQWCAPSLEWICLNIDGSICSSSHHARARGLLHDNIGSWILGFGRCIGTTDALIGVHRHLSGVYMRYANANGLLNLSGYLMELIK